jgi:hypothetical protein
VGLWCEFRQVPHFAESKSLIGELAKAVDEGCWCDFVKALGRPPINRAALPISIEKYVEQSLGLYGEPLGLRIAGIKYGNVVFTTRFRTWVIKKKAPDQNCTQEFQKSVASAVGDQDSERQVVHLPPWSSVNNCT